MTDYRFRAVLNTHGDSGVSEPSAELDPTRALAVHRRIRRYRPTPLHTLPSLAREIGIGSILLKDEGTRFGIGAFKALGASHAVARLLSKTWEDRFGEHLAPESFTSRSDVDPLGRFTFTTATDGNHGRALAWTARRLGQRAEIFMPAGSASARVQAIRGEGATVTVIDGPYDAAVAACRTQAQREGWHMVSDTSWPGYETIPLWVTEGYLTLFAEMHDQLRAAALPTPDLVVVPGGVGTLAHAVIDHCRRQLPTATVVIVEPIEAACLLESAESPAGDRCSASGRLDTIMAGLNCGTPSFIAWPVIRARADAFLAIGDAWDEDAVHRLASPTGNDPAIEAGESGASGLAALLALVKHRDGAPIRERLSVGPSSTVLLLATEGPTDPRSWTRIVGRSPSSGPV